MKVSPTPWSSGVPRAAQGSTPLWLSLLQTCQGHSLPRGQGPGRSLPHSHCHGHSFLFSLSRGPQTGTAAKPWAPVGEAALEMGKGALTPRGATDGSFQCSSRATLTVSLAEDPGAGSARCVPSVFLPPSCHPPPHKETLRKVVIAHL